MSTRLQKTDYTEKYTHFPKEYVTSKELQEIYGFSGSWLSKARMANSAVNIPYIKIGRAIRYSIKSINLWLEEHQVQGA